jgi:DNA polymerase III epsilon subunit-like protein
MLENRATNDLFPTKNATKNATAPAAAICVIDTETTGLPSDPEAAVVELAAVAIDDAGAELAHFASLVRPPELALRPGERLPFNGIAHEDLVGAPSPAEVAVDFLAWHSAHGSPTCTTFNVGFDAEMLRRMGLTPAWGRCLMFAAADLLQSAQDEDLAEEAVRWAGHLAWERDRRRWERERWEPAWPRLGEMLAFFSIEVEGDAHRALRDARAAAAVSVAMGGWWARYEERALDRAARAAAIAEQRRRRRARAQELEAWLRSFSEPHRLPGPHRLVMLRSGRWWCRSCRARWSSERAALRWRCPRQRLYRGWGQVPGEDQVATWSQLKRRGLVPVKAPIAWVDWGPQEQERTALYDPAKTRPRRQLVAERRARRRG